jgi:Zn-dependent peptidase ImmA (M78 family)
MAHEASHVILHRYLFDPVLAGRPLNGSDEHKTGYSRLMRCLHRDVVHEKAEDWDRTRRVKDWREVQANMGMAALLMPQRLFSRIARQQIDELELSDITKGSLSATSLSSAVANIFRVSKQAASIRLESLAIVSIP